MSISNGSEPSLETTIIYVYSTDVIGAAQYAISQQPRTHRQLQFRRFAMSSGAKKCVPSDLVRCGAADVPPFL